MSLHESRIFLQEFNIIFGIHHTIWHIKMIEMHVWDGTLPVEGGMHAALNVKGILQHIYSGTVVQCIECLYTCS